MSLTFITTIIIFDANDRLFTSRFNYRNVKISREKIIIQNIIIIKATLARPTRRAETSMTRFELFENWRQKQGFLFSFLDLMT